MLEQLVVTVLKTILLAQKNVGLCNVWQ